MTLKLFQQDGERQKRLEEKAEGFRRTTMRVLRMQLLSIGVMDLVAYAGAALGLAVALPALGKGDITAAGAIIILLLAPEYFLPLRLLGSYFHAAMTGVAAGDKILSLLDTAPARPACDVPETYERELREEGIAFENVWFGYTPETPVLRGISFDLRPRETAAFIGESGSGKSTLALLLARFLDPLGGSIRFGNIDIREVSVSELRRKIALVTHDAYLFSGTIAENLRMGMPDASDDQLISACTKAGAWDFVSSLPGRLSYSLDERGGNLSGGQRQRLAIARALLKHADVYIFDEAASNVDYESERAITRTMKELAEEKTVILISHRLSSVAHADVIFVLHEGIIAEYGKHDSLAQRQGPYARFLGKNRVREQGAFSA